MISFVPSIPTRKAAFGKYWARLQTLKVLEKIPPAKNLGTMLLKQNFGSEKKHLDLLISSASYPKKNEFFLKKWFCHSSFQPLHRISFSQISLRKKYKNKTLPETKIASRKGSRIVFLCHPFSDAFACCLFQVSGPIWKKVPNSSKAPRVPPKVSRKRPNFVPNFVHEFKHHPIGNDEIVFGKKTKKSPNLNHPTRKAPLPLLVLFVLLLLLPPG